MITQDMPPEIREMLHKLRMLAPYDGTPYMSSPASNVLRVLAWLWSDPPEDMGG